MNLPKWTGASTASSFYTYMISKLLFTITRAYAVAKQTSML